MPIEYDYDQNLNIVHARPFGEVSTSEIEIYFNKLFCDNQIANGFVEIVHFEKVDNFMFSSNQALSIAKTYHELKVQKGVSLTVFIGTNDLNYGISRLFQTFIEFNAPDHPVHVVRNEEEAYRLIKDIVG